jgi:hypothetical protein
MPMARLLLIYCGLLVGETFVVAAVVSADWIEEQIWRERELVRSTIGEATESSLHETSTASVAALFDATGVRETTHRLVALASVRRPHPVGLDDLGQPVVYWGASRLDVFWNVLYQSAYRLALLSHWLPYCITLLAPSAIDGLMQRKITQRTFGYASPVRYNTAVHLLSVALFVIPIYLFLPLAVTPVIVPLWAAAVALVILLVAANLQKRI